MSGSHPDRGIPPPHGPRVDFWNSDYPAVMVPLGELFGDLRHWIGRQTRRHRPANCAGCMAGIPTQWAGYVMALRCCRDRNHPERSGERPVCWNVPEGNADDLSGRIIGYSFDCRKAPPSSPRKLKISRLATPARVGLPAVPSMDAYLTRRERFSAPIQPIPGDDETTHEAVARFLAAERQLAELAELATPAPFLDLAPEATAALAPPEQLPRVTSLGDFSRFRPDPKGGAK
jgi:hypothetical protein